MRFFTGYAVAVGWAVCFLALAFVVRWAFHLLTPFSLRWASDSKDAAVGHVLRGLYIALAIISFAAIQSTTKLGWALVDAAISMALLLVFFKIYDWIDRRDFPAELASGNTMLGMELEGLFIILAGVVVAAMNLLG
jgi:hypothetical protein